MSFDRDLYFRVNLNMINKKLTLVALATAFVLVGCKNMSPDAMLSTGMKAFEAATISDTEIKAIADEACVAYDNSAKIASADSKYAKRLEAITKKFGNNIDGQNLTYKVYMDSETINAWAMANGCIRVYSGLMDFMNDDEVAGVVGHEIGHVMEGHRKKAVQVAYAAQIARDAAASSGNAVASSLSQSELGDLTQELINAQFSQAQEFEADDYSLKLLKQKGLNPEGMASAFDKLASLGGGSSMFSTHPDSAERAKRMREQIKAK